MKASPKRFLQFSWLASHTPVCASKTNLPSFIKLPPLDRTAQDEDIVWARTEDRGQERRFDSPRPSTHGLPKLSPGRRVPSWDRAAGAVSWPDPPPSIQCPRGRTGQVRLAASFQEQRLGFPLSTRTNGREDASDSCGAASPATVSLRRSRPAGRVSISALTPGPSTNTSSSIRKRLGCFYSDHRDHLRVCRSHDPSPRCQRKADDEEAPTATPAPSARKLNVRDLDLDPGTGSKRSSIGRCRPNTKDRAADPRHRKSPAQAHDQSFCSLQSGESGSRLDGGANRSW